ncbi:DUF4271 domain-containing protein [Apibacter muscae]|uniref:DUF4271 domain-containing protein n=1 Tax=Apibacter muscae TaxID=2509004 RepID=A0A563DA21_9FLAO|nr:DUF4271 domain-containing protein [Apibacter muscae]TWP26634.1 DUF4271 domain-containing protein [Apibacter muscae]TWP28208.1 DUF4271 domain-containing protein [Apibacter muscae]
MMLKFLIINPIPRPSIDDNLINYIVLSSLFILVLSRIVLLPKKESFFRFKALMGEDENFTLFTSICALLYLIFLSLVLVPFFKIHIPFNNSQLAKISLIFTFLCIYHVTSHVLGNSFIYILGKKEEYKVNNINNFRFTFIKLVISILLCFIIYYTNIPRFYALNIAIFTLGIILTLEWIYLMFFIKKNINIPNYYDFLYLCAFKILPTLCLIKIAFLGEEL